MNKQTQELIKRNADALESARWALESVRVKYVIGEDCAKLERLEAELSALIAEDSRELTKGREGE